MPGRLQTASILMVLLSAGTHGEELVGQETRLSAPKVVLADGAREVLLCENQKKDKKGKKKGASKSKWTRHKVIPGETLRKIALGYGVQVKELMHWNRLKGHFIREGQSLLVRPRIKPPSREKVSYLVRRGDTLGKIARRYKVTERRLAAFNHIKTTSIIRPGQELVIWVDGPVPIPRSVGSPSGGKLVNGMQMPPGRGYWLRRPKSSYGTALTIRVLRRAFQRMVKRLGRRCPEAVVGDLSRKHGGSFKPHVSHQSGRDADIGYYVKGMRKARRFVHVGAKNLDVAKTWLFIEALLKSEKVEYIFIDYPIQALLYKHAQKKKVRKGYLDKVFEYPKGRGSKKGIIRHDRGHDDHMHIRFVCPESSKKCRD